jgi:hypothetical protein
MNFKASSLVARAKSFAQTFGALPVFIIVTLIPWLLAAHALVLSHHFYEAGRDSLGITFKIAAMVIAGFTALSTLWFVAIWLVMLVRCVFGWEKRSAFCPSTPSTDNKYLKHYDYHLAWTWNLGRGDRLCLLPDREPHCQRGCR